MKIILKKSKKKSFTTGTEIYDERNRVKKQIISLESKLIFLNNIYKNLSFDDYVPFSKEELFENMAKINHLSSVTERIQEPNYPITDNPKDILYGFASFVNYEKGFKDTYTEGLIDEYIKKLNKKRAETGSKVWKNEY